LKTRTWIIQKGENEIEQVLNQPGVVGYYPKVHSNMETFIYES